MEFLENLIEGDIVDIYIRESLMDQKGYRQSIGKGEIVTLRVASYNGSTNVEAKRTILVKEDKKGLLFPGMHIVLSQLNHPIFNLKVPPYMQYDERFGFQPASIHMVSLYDEDIEKAWSACFDTLMAQFDSLVKLYNMKGRVKEKDE